MTAYRHGEQYISRSDNTPELIQALSMWGFPADFDPCQLPTGMFCCVMDEWSQIKREKSGLPRLPEKTCGEVWPAAHKAIEVSPVEKSGNWICYLGAAIAAFGYGAYLNGYQVGGTVALLLAATIYFSMPKVKP